MKIYSNIMLCVCVCVIFYFLQSNKKYSSAKLIEIDEIGAFVKRTYIEYSHSEN